MTKICNCCGIEKKLTKFYKEKKNSDKRKGMCAECCVSRYKESRKRYYENNKSKIQERQKIYNLENIDSIKRARNIRYKRNAEKRRLNYLINGEKIRLVKKAYLNRKKDYIAEWTRNYWLKNKERIKERKKKYHEANKERLLARRRELYNLKRKNDPRYKICHSLRQRVRSALQGKLKHKNTFDLVGCDLNFLKTYLENQFLEGMTWENYGLHGWHIDHIKPCDSFDLIKLEEQVACFHYTNLRPLWAEDNLSKNNRIGIKYGNQPS